MQAIVQTLGVYLPQKILHNNEIAQKLDTSDEWIFQHTGIHERRIASAEEACSDLAYNAATSALGELHKHDEGQFSAADIDLIVLATSTADFRCFPSTACIVQERLAAHSAGAFDISAACTGFVYALELAHSCIVSESAKNVLVIGAEIFSKIVNWEDRSTCILFGDGAGAAIVCASDECDRGIQGSILLSKGSGAEHLYCPSGGSRNPYINGSTIDDSSFVYMNGRQVYVFAIRAITETIEALLDKYNLNMDDIDHIVPHQANLRIIEAVCKRNSWPLEKFFLNIDRFANTSAASIPIAMQEMHERKLLQRGDKILTVGFGAGLTYGGNYIIW